MGGEENRELASILFQFTIKALIGIRFFISLENIITTFIAFLYKQDKVQGEDGTILSNV